MPRDERPSEEPTEAERQRERFNDLVLCDTSGMLLPEVPPDADEFTRKLIERERYALGAKDGDAPKPESPSPSGGLSGKCQLSLPRIER